MAKQVMLYVQIGQAKKLALDPSYEPKITPIKYDGLNGVWDDLQKKFVAPGTIDWSFVNKLTEEVK